ncbi:hypothetical protein WDU94_001228 [Cyamophila willieti]
MKKGVIGGGSGHLTSSQHSPLQDHVQKFREAPPEHTMQSSLHQDAMVSQMTRIYPELSVIPDRTSSLLHNNRKSMEAKTVKEKPVPDPALLLPDGNSLGLSSNIIGLDSTPSVSKLPEFSLLKQRKVSTSLSSTPQHDSSFNPLLLDNHMISEHNLAEFEKSFNDVIKSNLNIIDSSIIAGDRNEFNSTHFYRNSPHLIEATPNSAILTNCSPHVIDPSIQSSPHLQHSPHLQSSPHLQHSPHLQSSPHVQSSPHLILETSSSFNSPDSHHSLTNTDYSIDSSVMLGQDDNDSIKPVMQNRLFDEIMNEKIHIESNIAAMNFTPLEECLLQGTFNLPTDIPSALEKSISMDIQRENMKSNNVYASDNKASETVNSTSSQEDQPKRLIQVRSDLFQGNSTDSTKSKSSNSKPQSKYKLLRSHQSTVNNTQKDNKAEMSVPTIRVDKNSNTIQPKSSLVTTKNKGNKILDPRDSSSQDGVHNTPFNKALPNQTKSVEKINLSRNRNINESIMYRSNSTSSLLPQANVTEKKSSPTRDLNLVKSVGKPTCLQNSQIKNDESLSKQDQTIIKSIDRMMVKPSGKPSSFQNSQIKECQSATVSQGKTSPLHSDTALSNEQPVSITTASVTKETCDPYSFDTESEKIPTNDALTRKISKDSHNTNQSIVKDNRKAKDEHIETTASHDAKTETATTNGPESLKLRIKKSDTTIVTKCSSPKTSEPNVDKKEHEDGEKKKRSHVSKVSTDGNDDSNCANMSDSVEIDSSKYTSESTDETPGVDKPTIVTCTMGENPMSLKLKFVKNSPTPECYNESKPLPDDSANNSNNRMTLRVKLPPYSDDKKSPHQHESNEEPKHDVKFPEKLIINLKTNQITRTKEDSINNNDSSEDENKQPALPNVQQTLCSSPSKDKRKHTRKIDDICQNLRKSTESPCSNSETSTNVESKDEKQVPPYKKSNESVDIAKVSPASTNEPSVPEQTRRMTIKFRRMSKSGENVFVKQCDTTAIDETDDESPGGKQSSTNDNSELESDYEFKKPDLKLKIRIGNEVMSEQNVNKKSKKKKKHKAKKHKDKLTKLYEAAVKSMNEQSCPEIKKIKIKLGEGKTENEENDTIVKPLILKRNNIRFDKEEKIDSSSINNSDPLYNCDTSENNLSSNEESEFEHCNTADLADKLLLQSKKLSDQLESISERRPKEERKRNHNQEMERSENNDTIVEEKSLEEDTIPSTEETNAADEISTANSEQESLLVGSIKGNSTKSSSLENESKSETPHLESSRAESCTLDKKRAESKTEILTYQTTDQTFKCETCTKEFTSEFEYNKHKVLIHAYNAFLCHICYVSFVEKWKLEIHLMSEEHLAMVSSEVVPGVEANQTRITRRSKRGIVDTSNTPEKEPTSRNSQKKLNEETYDSNSSASSSPKKDSKRNNKKNFERNNVEKVEDTKQTYDSVKSKTRCDSTKTGICNKTEQLSSDIVCTSKEANDESEQLKIDEKSSDCLDKKLTDRSTIVNSTVPPTVTSLDCRTETENNDAQMCVENIPTVSLPFEKSVVEVKKSESSTSYKNNNIGKTSSDGALIVDTITPSSLEPESVVQVTDKPITPFNEDDPVPTSSNTYDSSKSSEDHIEGELLKINTTIPNVTKESKDIVNNKIEVPATSSITETSSISLDLDLLEQSIPTSIITTKRLTIRKEELNKNLEALTGVNECVTLGETKTPQKLFNTQVVSTTSKVEHKKNLRPPPKLRPLPNLIKISPENLKLIPTIKANILNKKDSLHLKDVIVKDNKLNVDNSEQIVQDNKATVIEQEKERTKSQCNTNFENCQSLLDINTVVTLSTSIDGLCVNKINPVQPLQSVDHNAKKTFVDPEKKSKDSKTTSENYIITCKDSKTLEDSETAEESKTTPEDSKTSPEDFKTTPQDSTTASEDSKTASEDSKSVFEDSKTPFDDNSTNLSDDSKKTFHVATLATKDVKKITDLENTKNETKKSIENECSSIEIETTRRSRRIKHTVVKYTTNESLNKNNTREPRKRTVALLEDEKTTTVKTEPQTQSKLAFDQDNVDNGDMGEEKAQNTTYSVATKSLIHHNKQTEEKTLRKSPRRLNNKSVETRKSPRRKSINTSHEESSGKDQKSISPSAKANDSTISSGDEPRKIAHLEQCEIKKQLNFEVNELDNTPQSSHEIPSKKNENLITKVDSFRPKVTSGSTHGDLTNDSQNTSNEERNTVEMKETLWEKINIDLNITEGLKRSLGLDKPLKIEIPETEKSKRSKDLLINSDNLKPNSQSPLETKYIQNTKNNKKDKTFSPSKSKNKKNLVKKQLEQLSQLAAQCSPHANSNSPNRTIQNNPTETITKTEANKIKTRRKTLEECTNKEDSKKENPPSLVQDTPVAVRKSSRNRKIKVFPDEIVGEIVRSQRKRLDKSPLSNGPKNKFPSKTETAPQSEVFGDQKGVATTNIKDHGQSGGKRKRSRRESKTETTNEIEMHGSKKEGLEKSSDLEEKFTKQIIELKKELDVREFKNENQKHTSDEVLAEQLLKNTVKSETLEGFTCEIPDNIEYFTNREENTKEIKIEDCTLHENNNESGVVDEKRAVPTIIMWENAHESKPNQTIPDVESKDNEVVQKNDYNNQEVVPVEISAINVVDIIKEKETDTPIQNLLVVQVSTDIDTQNMETFVEKNEREDSTEKSSMEDKKELFENVETLETHGENNIKTEEIKPNDDTEKKKEVCVEKSDIKGNENLVDRDSVFSAEYKDVNNTVEKCIDELEIKINKSESTDFVNEQSSESLASNVNQEEEIKYVEDNDNEQELDNISEGGMESQGNDNQKNRKDIEQKNTPMYDSELPLVEDNVIVPVQTPETSDTLDSVDLLHESVILEDNLCLGEKDGFEQIINKANTPVPKKTKRKGKSKQRKNRENTVQEAIRPIGSQSQLKTKDSEIESGEKEYKIPTSNMINEEFDEHKEKELLEISDITEDEIVESHVTEEEDSIVTTESLEDGNFDVNRKSEILQLVESDNKILTEGKSDENEKRYVEEDNEENPNSPGEVLDFYKDQKENGEDVVVFVQSGESSNLSTSNIINDSERLASGTKEDIHMQKVNSPNMKNNEMETVKGVKDDQENLFGVKESNVEEEKSIEITTGSKAILESGVEEKYSYEISQKDENVTEQRSEEFRKESIRENTLEQSLDPRKEEKDFSKYLVVTEQELESPGEMTENKRKHTLLKQGDTNEVIPDFTEGEKETNNGQESVLLGEISKIHKETNIESMSSSSVMTSEATEKEKPLEEKITEDQKSVSLQEQSNVQEVDGKYSDDTSERNENLHTKTNGEELFTPEKDENAVERLNNSKEGIETAEEFVFAGRESYSLPPNIITEKNSRSEELLEKEENEPKETATIQDEMELMGKVTNKEDCELLPEKSNIQEEICIDSVTSAVPMSKTAGEKDEGWNDDLSEENKNLDIVENSLSNIHNEKDKDQEGIEKMLEESNSRDEEIDSTEISAVTEQEPKLLSSNITEGKGEEWFDNNKEYNDAKDTVELPATRENKIESEEKIIIEDNSIPADENMIEKELVDTREKCRLDFTEDIIAKDDESDLVASEIIKKKGLEEKFKLEENDNKLKEISVYLLQTIKHEITPEQRSVFLEEKSDIQEDGEETCVEEVSDVVRNINDTENNKQDICIPSKEKTLTKMSDNRKVHSEEKIMIIERDSDLSATNVMEESQEVGEKENNDDQKEISVEMAAEKEATIEYEYQLIEEISKVQEENSIELLTKSDDDDALSVSVEFLKECKNLNDKEINVECIITPVETPLDIKEKANIERQTSNSVSEEYGYNDSNESSNGNENLDNIGNRSYEIDTTDLTLTEKQSELPVPNMKDEECEQFNKEKGKQEVKLILPGTDEDASDREMNNHQNLPEKEQNSRSDTMEDLSESGNKYPMSHNDIFAFESERSREQLNNELFAGTGSSNQMTNSENSNEEISIPVEENVREVTIDITTEEVSINEVEFSVLNAVRENECKIFRREKVIDEQKKLGLPNTSDEEIQHVEDKVYKLPNNQYDRIKTVIEEVTVEQKSVVLTEKPLIQDVSIETNSTISVILESKGDEQNDNEEISERNKNIDKGDSNEEVIIIDDEQTVELESDILGLDSNENSTFTLFGDSEDQESNNYTEKRDNDDREEMSIESLDSKEDDMEPSIKEISDDQNAVLGEKSYTQEEEKEVEEKEDSCIDLQLGGYEDEFSEDIFKEKGNLNDKAHYEKDTISPTEDKTVQELNVEEEKEPTDNIIKTQNEIDFTATNITKEKECQEFGETGSSIEEVGLSNIQEPVENEITNEHPFILLAETSTTQEERGLESVTQSNILKPEGCEENGDGEISELKEKDLEDIVKPVVQKTPEPVFREDCKIDYHCTVTVLDSELPDKDIIKEQEREELGEKNEPRVSKALLESNHDGVDSVVVEEEEKDKVAIEQDLQEIREEVLVPVTKEAGVAYEEIEVHQHESSVNALENNYNIQEKSIEDDECNAIVEDNECKVSKNSEEIDPTEEIPVTLKESDLPADNIEEKESEDVGQKEDEKEQTKLTDSQKDCKKCVEETNNQKYVLLVENSNIEKGDMINNYEYKTSDEISMPNESASNNENSNEDTSIHLEEEKHENAVYTEQGKIDLVEKATTKKQTPETTAFNTTDHEEHDDNAKREVSIVEKRKITEELYKTGDNEMEPKTFEVSNNGNTVSVPEKSVCREKESIVAELERCEEIYANNISEDSNNPNYEKHSDQDTILAQDVKDKPLGEDLNVKEEIDSIKETTLTHREPDLPVSNIMEIENKVIVDKKEIQVEEAIEPADTIENDIKYELKETSDKLERGKCIGNDTNVLAEAVQNYVKHIVFMEKVQEKPPDIIEAEEIVELEGEISINKQEKTSVKLPDIKETKIEPLEKEVTEQEPVEVEKIDEEPEEKEFTYEESLEEKVTNEEPVDKQVIDEVSIEKEVFTKEFIGKEVINEKPVFNTVSIEEPVEKEVSNEEYVEKEVIDEDSIEKEAINKKPIGKEVTNEEPVEKKVTNENLVEKEVFCEGPLKQEGIPEEAVEKKVTNELVVQEVIDEEPVQKEVTKEAPVKKEVTNESPEEKEVTNEEPVDNEVTVKEPVEKGVTNEEPLERDVTNEQTVEKDVIDEEHVEKEVRNEEPVEKETIDVEPVEKEVIDEDPVVKEVINEEPVEREVTTEQTVEKEVIGEKPIEQEVINKEPVDKEVTNEVPVEKEKPVNDEEPVDEEVFNEEPVEREVTNEQTVEKEVICEKPIEQEVINKGPVDKEVTNEKTSR